MVVLSEAVQVLTNNWGNTVTTYIGTNLSDCSQLQSVYLVTS
jgi:hypothetical protein